MNILEEIASKRIEDVNKQKKIISLENIKEQAEKIAREEYKKNGKYLFSFKKAISKPGINFICEVKKASPSKGIIAEDFPYVDIAKEYETAGAAAISVLTEPHYFQGKDSYLKEIIDTVSIPAIRKDFIVDEYQIYETKILGASAILLICSLLEDDRLKKYLDIAHSLGLSALVETHDEEEIERAMRINPRIIGVNNRNLKDFTITLETTRRLRPYVPEDKVFVAESGIMSDEDVEFLKACHMDAFLIGRAFMEAENPKELAKRWKGV